MDQKLKNYSSGMQVRLAFSVAIQADGDILLLDEVLAVGDEAFQRKCNNYFKKLKDEKKTVILVTHSMENVRKYCSKAMMIQGGKIKLIGSPEDVANEYRLNNLDLSRTGKDRNFESDVIKSFKAELISSTTVSQNDKVKVKYSFVSNKKMKLNVSIDVSNYDEKYYIYCSQSKLKEVFPGVKNEITMVVDVSCINNMNVIVNSSLRDENFNPIVFIGEGDSPIFTIQRDDYTMGTPQPGVIFVDEVNVQWKDAH